MRRLFLTLMLIVSLTVSSFAFTAPAEALPGISDINGTFFIGQNSYLDNGRVMTMDVAPFEENGRTYVPVRYLAYMLGLTSDQIDYDAASDGVALNNGTIEVSLFNGDNNIYVNGYPIPMDVTPLASDNRLFLPASWVAQAFDAVVEWDPTMLSVTITSGDQTYDPYDPYNPYDPYDPYTDPNYDPNYDPYNDPSNDPWNDPTDNPNNDPSNDTNNGQQAHPWSTWGLGNVQQAYVNNNNRSYDWYIDQMNTGTYNYENCGPSSVTMAAKWADPSFSRTPEQARATYHPNGGWWYTYDITNYLDLYGIPNQEKANRGDAAMKQELDAGRIMILCIDSSLITENFTPAYHRDKFYSGGGGHFIVVKGYAVIDNVLWYEVCDPANGNEYYSDGQPRGKDRYYSAADIQYTMQNYWNRYIAIEQVDGTRTLDSHTGSGIKAANYLNAQKGAL